MRLQVVMAHAGCASRRKCAELVRKGLVRVNGKIITKPGFKIDPSKDKITCRGKKLALEEKVYILLNKPKGVITTTEDTHKRPTVFELLPESPHRLYHVGRLDKDTSGLLFITNDGEMAYRLTHPKFEVKRTYEVMVRGKPAKDDILKLEKGIYIEGGKTAPCQIHVLKRSIKKTLLKIRLHEGKKRQIRIMFKRIGCPVVSLERVSFGPLDLRGLKTGAYRFLSASEVERLWNSIGRG